MKNFIASLVLLFAVSGMAANAPVNNPTFTTALSLTNNGDTVPLNIQARNNDGSQSGLLTFLHGGNTKWTAGSISSGDTYVVRGSNGVSFFLINQSGLASIPGSLTVGGFSVLTTASLVGESNVLVSAANNGAQLPAVPDKSGTNLMIKSIVAGTGITISTNQTNITIAATGGGNSGVFTNLFTQTNDVTVANTATETSLKTTGTGSATIAANAIAQGTTVRVRAAGYTSEASGGGVEMVLRLKFGSTTLSTAKVFLETFPDVGWSIDCEISCRSVGATGSVVAGGDLSFKGSNTGIENFLKTTPTTINTTTTQAVDLTVEYEFADPDRTITCQQFTVDITHP